MAQIQDLIEPLFPLVGDAPDQLLISAYRTAAREFLRKTYAWKSLDLAIAQGAGAGEYDITPPTDGEVFDFTYAEHENHRLEKLTYEQARARNFSDSGSPRKARMGPLNTLILQPAPAADVSAELTVRAVIRPTKTADELPDDIVDRFCESFESGALEILMRTPNQPWSDINMSRYYRGLFRDDIEEAELRATDEFMRGVPRRVRYGGL